MKKLLLSAMLLIAIASVFWMAKETPQQGEGGLKVSTSIYPMYFLTKEIGGKRLDVVNLTPPGAEPHDYELTPQDLITIRKSRVLVVSGGVEAWLPKVKQSLKGETLVVEAGGGLMTLESVDESGHSSVDPHVWLSPDLMEKMADRIYDQLVLVDPKGKNEYQKNTDDLKKRLAAMDLEYRTKLSKCERKQVVTAHEAFGYLTGRYGLEQIGIAGLSPDEEPSIRRLSEVASLVKAMGVKVIFFEELVSPKLAETLAKETGITTMVLDPLEGLTSEKMARGDDYFSVMRNNLVNLSSALGCQ